MHDAVPGSPIGRCIGGDDSGGCESGDNLLWSVAGGTESRDAGQAAMCAADQGKFWQMHRTIFANQLITGEENTGNLSKARLKQIAATVPGIEAGAFASCLDGDKYASQITTNMNDATTQKVDSTPTFFVNGRKMVGAQPVESFKTVIDDELKKAEALVKQGVPPAQIYDRVMLSATNPAEPVRKHVEIDPRDPARGAAQPRVTVQLFTDFECPACSGMGAALDELLKTHGQKVRVVYRNRPISHHVHARLAAELALEAKAQLGVEGYLKAYTLLMQNQQALERSDLDEYGKRLGLDAKKLAAGGTRELILIAQDLTYYGLDIYKKRNLSELVARLSDVEGIDWIRLHYAFPSGFPMDVLDVMRDRSNVCNYLDMPLQHGSTNMLTRMRRGITQERTEKLVADIRDRVPGIAIRTTLIAGFPGETQEDHEDGLRWIERMRFDRLGCFTYSHEEDTHAFTMQDDVPFEVKQQRATEIMELQGSLSFNANQAKVGRVFKVMVDKAEGGYYHTRTEHDSPEVDNDVLVPLSAGHLRIGDLCDVRITAAREHEMDAVPLTR